MCRALERRRARRADHVAALRCCAALCACRLASLIALMALHVAWLTGACCTGRALSRADPLLTCRPHHSSPCPRKRDADCAPSSTDQSTASAAEVARPTAKHAAQEVAAEFKVL